MLIILELFTQWGAITIKDTTLFSTTFNKHQDIRPKKVLEFLSLFSSIHFDCQLFPLSDVYKRLFRNPHPCFLRNPFSLFLSLNDAGRSTKRRDTSNANGSIFPNGLFCSQNSIQSTFQAVKCVHWSVSKCNDKMPLSLFVSGLKLLVR